MLFAHKAVQHGQGYAERWVEVVLPWLATVPDVPFQNNLSTNLVCRELHYNADLSCEGKIQLGI